MPLTAAQRKRFRLSTTTHVASFFGVTPQTVKNWITAGMPRTERPKKGMKPAYDYQLEEIVAWLRTSGPWKRGDAQTLSGEDELMLGADPNSPALERWRHFKALDAELNYKERCGTLASVERIRTVLLRWASHIRRRVEHMASRYGREMAEQMNETLEECRNLIDHELGHTADREPTTGLGDPAGESASGADNGPMGRRRDRSAKRPTSRRKVSPPKPPGK